jgi:hypothetical protein
VPTLLDLFCGRGGWSEPALRAGWRCCGFDIVDHGFPGEFWRRRLPCDAWYLDSFRPSLVVASPPCEAFARECLPWGPREFGRRPDELAAAVDLLRWCVSLPGVLDCPVVVECSRFAARFVPGARFVGSCALWGDVPALLPAGLPRRKGLVSGTRDRAARRAVIEPELASWIFDVLGAGRQLPKAAAPARTLPH